MGQNIDYDWRDEGPCLKRGLGTLQMAKVLLSLQAELYNWQQDDHDDKENHQQINIDEWWIAIIHF